MLSQDSTNKPLAAPKPVKVLSDSAHLPLTITGPLPVGIEAGPTGPAALTAAPTVWGLFQALRRRWLLAAGVALVGAAAGVAAILLLLPPKYIAQTRLQVFSRTDAAFFLPSHSEPTDFVIYKANLAAQIKSPAVIAAALHQVKDLAIVREHPNLALWLETALKTDFNLGPEILRVTLGADNADDAAKLLNAVADAFLKEVETKERSKRTLRLSELEVNFREMEDKLNKKRSALRKEESREKLEDQQTMLAKYSAAQERVRQAEKAVLDVRLAQLTADQELKSTEEQEKTVDQWPVPESQLDDSLKQDLRAEPIFRALLKVQESIQQLRQNAVKAEGLLAGELQRQSILEKGLADLREQLRPDLENRERRKLRDKLRGDAFALTNKITSFKRQQEALQKEVDRARIEAADLNPSAQRGSLVVENMRNEVTRLETSLTELNKTIALLKAEPVAGSRVALLQQAEPPQSKDVSRQAKMAGVAGLGLFCLGLFGVSFWEFRSRRITGADEVSTGLGLTLIGTLPALPERARKPLTTNGAATSKDLYWQSQLSESVDAIRTLLLHAARSESLQVVMITSAVSGEGKTSLASQLAASLARAWRKTLFIDGDLRNPAAHRLFDLSLEPGFSEVLRGEVNLADAVKPTALSRLWLLPAGHWDSHAVQALAQEGVKSVFDQLKEQYDFIIVDSCPVLPVADSLLLGQNVDAVIFSVLRDVSRAPSVYAAHQRLASLGIRTLGAVVIGAENGAGVYQYPLARSG
jgi:succinoglycan biosynthesis transport protein ExoP